MNHEHKLVRLYEREKTKWVSTELYKCSVCGAILEKKFNKVEVEHD